MGVSKVVIDNEIKVDLTGDTVTADKMVQGITAHDKSGEPIEGTLAEVNRAAPKMSTSYVQQNNIYLRVTATVNQEAGVVDAGEKTADYLIPAMRERTVTPSTNSYVVFPAGFFAHGATTVLGDANLVAENIRSGTSIFGVAGSFAGEIPYVPRFLWAYEDYVLTHDPTIMDNGSIPEDLTDSILLFFPVHWGSMQWDYTAGNRLIMYAAYFQDEWYIGSTSADNMGLEFFDLVSDGSTISIDAGSTAFILNGLYMLLSPAYAI